MFNFLKQEIMKKLLLLAPIAALALASCSNDEQIAQSPALNAQEVTFRPVVNGTTRTVTTDANFDKFHVVATITNDNTKYAFWEALESGDVPTAATVTNSQTSLDMDVTKSATTGKWEVVGGKTWYWSSKNAEASFKAYNANGSITVPEAIANQKDVLVAYNEGVASSFDNGVPMLFRHVLSQIVIKADNADADIRQIQVGGVRIHNVGNTNTLTLPTSETTADKFKWYDATSAADGYKPWAANPSTQASKYTYYKGTAPAANAVYNDTYITLNGSAQEITFGGAALLLPQTKAAADLTAASVTGAYIDVLVKVQLAGSDATGKSDTEKAIYPKINVNTTGEVLTDQQFAWVAVPVDIDWQPGYKYTYILHFSKDGIGKVSPDDEGGDPDPGPQPGEEIVDNAVPLYFTVTIDEWNDAANTEKNL